MVIQFGYLFVIYNEKKYKSKGFMDVYQIVNLTNLHLYEFLKNTYLVSVEALQYYKSIIPIAVLCFQLRLWNGDFT